MSCLRRLALAAVLALLRPPALAQGYPEPADQVDLGSFPPGGATDVIARVVGQPLGVRLGQQVIVDNRPGSNGNIAAEVAAKARPDGYTLMIGSDSLFGINPHLYAKMPVDPLKDLLPVAEARSRTSWCSPQSKTLGRPRILREFVDLARASPPLFYASIGNGSQHHLAMEMLKRAAGIDITHVPYKGGGPAALGVIAGDAAAMFGGGSVVPLIKSGQLHALAVTGTMRSKMLPDLPTIAEIYPGFEVTIWQGAVAPAGTPQAIIDKLRSEMTGGCSRSLTLANG